jgi:predicted TIM-barrel fold metal-dependent hydrolase
VQSPWGDLAVRDGHVHFFGDSFFSLLTGGRAASEVCAQLGWETADAPRWIAELDRHGVASASLIASLHGDEESVASAIAQYPTRLHGQFMLNPLAPDALDRARRAFQSGLSTMCLFPAMHRFSVSDDALLPLWKAAEGRNVFVHCGVLSVGVRKKLGLPSPFDMRYSNPLDLHGVALRNPSIHFIVPHFGAGMFREALMLADLCPNVLLDTSSSNGWIKYCEAPMTLADVFRKALAVAGAGRLVFGTDSSFFPRGWVRGVFDAQVAALQECGISPEDAAEIFGGNLRRLNSY